jgi:FG-GAP-like repeat
LADFDGDGRLDLLSGSNCCDPYGLHIFRRRRDGSFEPRRHLEVDVPAEDRESPTHQSRLCVTDWDGDGQPDLLFTTTKASCLYVGTRRPDGDEPMRVRRVDLPGPPCLITGNLAVADWDSDGLADLVLGQWHTREFGRISWFRNVGRPGEPRFEEGRALVPGTEGPPYNSGFCVMDWDGDGRLDLLLARVEQRQDPSRPNGWDIRGRLWLYPGR